MPELVPIRPYVGELLKKFPYFPPERKDFLKFAARHQLEVIGIGQSSGVISVDLRNGKDRVFAWDYTHRFYDYPLEAKLDFNANHILNRLHPEHFPLFPAVHNAHIGKGGKLITGGSLRERVYPVQPVTSPAELQEVVDKATTWYANGIPLDLDFVKLDNWVYDNKGDLRYLDVPHRGFYANLDETNPWDYSKIRHFMEGKNHKTPSINEVVAFAKRMRHLEVLEFASRSAVIFYEGCDDDYIRQDLDPISLRFILEHQLPNCDISDVCFTKADLKLVFEKIRLNRRAGKI